LNRLDPIIAATREELARRRDSVPLAAVEAAAARRAQDDPVRGFEAALARPGLSVIAEHKRRSPSAGAIREDLELEDVVGAYERGGAAALSILTGADAILLIVAALSEADLAALYGEAVGLGLGVLVEVHDARELEVALNLAAGPPRVIGINNRDLKTLEVDTGRTFELLPSVSGHALVVSESGFSRPGQLDELVQAGLDAVLIGEALMRSPDVEAACRELAVR
jgi:indole-3-glycerol phosphate synthase